MITFWDEFGHEEGKSKATRQARFKTGQWSEVFNEAGLHLLEIQTFKWVSTHLQILKQSQ